MFKAIIEAIFDFCRPATAEPITPPHTTDIHYISILTTHETYTSGVNKREIYYDGVRNEIHANEWSLSILVNDILLAHYDRVGEEGIGNTVRATFNTKHSRTIEVPVADYHTACFDIRYFDDKEAMDTFHQKVMRE